MTEEQVEDIFARMDVDGAGFVTFEHFFQNFTLFVRQASLDDMPSAAAGDATADDGDDDDDDSDESKSSSKETRNKKKLQRVKSTVYFQHQRTETLDAVWEFVNNITLSRRRVDPEMYMGLKEQFEEADVHGRGWIGRDEFGALMLEHLSDEERDEMASDDDAKQAFEERVSALWDSMDRNHDGKMTFSEFLLSYTEKDYDEEENHEKSNFHKSISQVRDLPKEMVVAADLKRSTSLEEAKQMYDWVDDDDDGFVTIDDMQMAVMHSIGRYMTEEEYDAIHHMMAVKGTDKIPLDQFALLMKRWTESVQAHENDDDNDDDDDDNNNGQVSGTDNGNGLKDSMSSTMLQSFRSAVGVNFDDLERAVMEAKAENRTLRQKLIKLENANKKTLNRYGMLKAHATEVDHANNNLMTEVARLKRERNSISKKLEVKRHALERADQTAQEAKRKLHEQELKVQELRNAHQELGAEHERDKKEMRRLMAKIQVLQREKTISVDYSASGRESPVSRRSEHGASADTISTDDIRLQEATAKLRADVSKYRKRAAALLTENEALLDTLSDEKQARAEADSMADAMRERVAELEERVRQLELETAAADAEPAKIRVHHQPSLSLASQLFAAGSELEMQQRRGASSSSSSRDVSDDNAHRLHVRRGRHVRTSSGGQVAASLDTNPSTSEVNSARDLLSQPDPTSDGDGERASGHDPHHHHAHEDDVGGKHCPMCHDKRCVIM
eukprot:TRINITY_DN65849_c0_g1_i2.p1 TRINITY_DN65849_c0_g1~~TRINITY_DN65849_c0_g1_i2.p1  ORF type:complete len:730 (+),score=363.50 TRINITY_DN65849_c0_g1_i2:322-2511(+)